VLEVSNPGQPKQLLIDNKPYAELDQVIAEYVQAIIDRTKQVMSCKKFKRFKLDDMCNRYLYFLDDYISRECEKAKGSVYGFILSPRKSGMFHLVYQHYKASSKAEYIEVKADGFLFRNELLKTIDDVVVHFKTSEMKKMKELAKNPVQKTPVAYNQMNQMQGGYGYQQNPPMRYDNRYDDRSGRSGPSSSNYGTGYPGYR
jgi:hypothetical protein